MKSFLNIKAITNKFNIIGIILLFVFSHSCLYSQENPSIKVITRNYLDSVTIRWAPNKASAWKLLNKYGYILERRTVYRNGKFIIDKPDVKVLSSAPIKPWTKEKFEQLGDTTTEILIIYQAIYGENFQLNATEGEAGPVAMINQADELDNRFSFSLFSADNSLKAAKMHGLYFSDKEVKPGEKYVYRVYSAVPDTIMRIDSGFVYLNMADTFTIPKPYDLKVDFRNHSAVISWNREFFENIFVNYIVERSDDQGLTYHSISDIPMINTYTEPNKKPLRYLLIDSLPQNNHIYKYRVKGITVFGDISQPSDIAEGSGFETGDMLNPDIRKIEVTPDNKVVLKWNMTSEDSVYVKGFDVLRAESNDGVYSKLNSYLLTEDIRLFIDSAPKPVNYYRVNAIDSKKRIFPSFTEMVQLIDSIPPKVPQNISGYIDSSGLVHLKWDKNKEIDLASYRIFKANNPNAEFLKVNQNAVLSNYFTDTTILKTLSPYLYYRITAIDQRYNQSEYSKILRLKRPDIVPPAAPVIFSYNISDSGVLINWINSPSEDVLKHKLFRRKPVEFNSVLIAEYDSSLQISSFIDTTAEDGNIYQYILKAIDDSGLESEASTLNVKIPVKNNKPGVYSFSAQVKYDEGGIELNWKYSGVKAESFLIYRGDNQKVLGRYGSVSSNESKLLDKGIIKETTYEYCVQAVFADGSKSKMSEIVKVKY